ncbi:MAG: 30S ribosomal protein S12 methylthiotransferase RimO [Bacteroidales bacterium]|nr:30S ribosomal protein S12 methylthiotransferase RimO [Bacteroidales bacterium]
MTKHNPSINIITLGCSKNSVDSEVMAAQWQKMGHKVLQNSTEDTDVVIINTCSFIRDAKEQSIDEILLHVERKKAGMVKKIYVVGCLAQRYKDDLQQMIPEVDAFFTFAELHQLFQLDQFDLLAQSDRLLSTPSHYAYLKISEGCDRCCSYCAIPLIRGKQVSKPIETLVEEAQKLAQNGVKELMLIAQDLTYYGMDLSGHRDLEMLLRRLAQVNGLEWIRLHYAYPIGFPYEILDVMNEYSSICKYLDMPLQHINEDILRDMRRGGGGMQTYKLIEKIRQKVPGIALRTTLISGYPTETKAQHKELVQFVKEMRFERLGVFAYSQEEGTPAYPLGDPIRTAEKNHRVEEIMGLQEEISLTHNKSLVGQVMKVMVDDVEDEFYIGRTEFDSPDVDNTVLIDKKQPLTPGQFHPVRITAADHFDLYGTIVKNQKEN